MGWLCNGHRLLIGSLRDGDGIRMGYPWAVFGVSMRFPLIAHGYLMGGLLR